jgi:hypothetical protein
VLVSGRFRLEVSDAREWRNRQTRTVQVRVPERVWGFNSPLAHQKKKAPASHISEREPSSLLVVWPVASAQPTTQRDCPVL